jgi:hypothetical protein
MCLSVIFSCLFAWFISRLLAGTIQCMKTER